MDRILNIETSTGVCSVAVSEGGRILSCKESPGERSHSAMLTLLIEEAMKEASTGFDQLSAVAVSRGPGSYTGLRIGVSVSKGICYASSTPLIAIDTLRIMNLMAAASSVSSPQAGLKAGPGTERLIFCPMIDARRMEVYMALFDSGGNQVSKITAEIIDENTFSKLGENRSVLFFGDGAEKCRNLLESANATYLPGIYPSAKYMTTLSHEALRRGNFEDTAYFEPFYLKDFIATKPGGKSSVK